ncbi:BON domain-containing protein [Acidovorax sp.]|uniref:BON domain-containing protein n=1 Tax=Acidovorax sp. TaxID=1872122 RepID=UPI00403817AB
MRRHRYAAPFALVGLIALAGLQGCAPILIGAGGVAAYTALEDRRTAGTQMEDQGIESRATTRIAERFREQAHVNTNVFNRTVLLTGEAWDEATRAEIEKIVLAVPNVRTVTNEIQVSGLSSAGSRANDTTLTARVKGRFLNAKGFNPLHIKVVTETGVVYLMGLVTEAEGEAATEIARRTDGVRKVIKVFDYCKSTDELCAPPKSKPKPAA